MEGGETFPVLGNGSQGDYKVMQTFHKSFGQVQSRLDQNRKLINEINQNQASRIPGRLNRNVRLIGELNSNIRRVVDVDVELPLSFTGSMEASPEAEAASQGKPGYERVIIYRTQFLRRLIYLLRSTDQISYCIPRLGQKFTTRCVRQ
ncbi:unnamed protein product [Musa acuminata subsp. malaccensis]|uniref:(wild Malaysian banana) hypothetical protein n=1 Tax=Musa acuminata subsp. malaccensis TaxID=214687 RepID=A0A804KSC3_MUSAM|nr:PREDICTED: protein ELF4-LIKE 3-like [Musa acuminata subsp. malaccensis]XP_018675229.1 PREDICTED: protein ELF4-LIKE 3-like [Musa acuminata subsp. malaccensis]CAG1852749.1 unnamed protein product [Musa acuminata subsp. malaccensis]